MFESLIEFFRQGSQKISDPRKVAHVIPIQGQRRILPRRDTSKPRAIARSKK